MVRLDFSSGVPFLWTGHQSLHSLMMRQCGHVRPINTLHYDVFEFNHSQFKCAAIAISF